MKKRYRIFHLIKGLGRGGAEMLLSEGLPFSNREHFEYSYGYFLPWKDALVEALKNRGAEVACFRSRSNFSILSSVPRLASYFRKQHLDLVHCHLPVAGMAGRLAGKLARVPVIYTEHNVMERYHAWTRRGNLLTWRMQRHVVAVSEEVKSSIVKHAGERVPVTVVQNGIATDMFQMNLEDRSKIRKQYSIPENAPVVGTVAVLRKQKDLSTWIQSASILLEQHADAHFLIVGDGPLKMQLQSEAEAAGLSSVLHFTGLQEIVTPYFSAMDVYMSSSIFEGLPLALLEAMAMKLPVVVTAVGGVPEVVEEGKTGFLAEPKNPQALAEKVSLLLAQKDLRQIFGTAGRRVVEERFGIKTMIGRLEALYLQILGRNSVEN